MVRLYLDLETYRAETEGAFTGEKIISVGFLRDETRYEESSLKETVEPVFFSEWKEGSEEKVLLASKDFVEQMIEDHRFTAVVGFNILRYDILLLVARAGDYGIPVAGHSKMWYDAYTTDYFQILLPANHNLFKGLRFDRIVEKAKELGLNPPEPYGVGADVREWYRSRQYAEILTHCTRDLQITRWLDLYGSRRLIAESIRHRGPLFRD